MVLRIRLARFGKRNKPFYNIVVAHARTAQKSKPLEVLGTYDPIPKLPPTTNDIPEAQEESGENEEGRPRMYKDIRLDRDRAQYWLGVGAQPSDTAWRLLSMIGLMEPKYRVDQIQRTVQKVDKVRNAKARNQVAPS